MKLFISLWKKNCQCIARVCAVWCKVLTLRCGLARGVDYSWSSRSLPPGSTFLPRRLWTCSFEDLGLGRPTLLGKGWWWWFCGEMLDAASGFFNSTSAYLTNISCSLNPSMVFCQHNFGIFENVSPQAMYMVSYTLKLGVHYEM